MGKGEEGHIDKSSFVVKYVLFFFNWLFWVIALILVSIAVYARVAKHGDADTVSLTTDPAIMLMVVGVLMFIITFCGCVGSLWEDICLLQTFCVCLSIIFLLQLAAGIWGFVFSDKAWQKVNKVVNKAIIHYRDDLDLQNLIDYGQREFGCCGAVSYRDWSMNMYFNCSDSRSKESCGVPFSCCLISKDKSVINTMCGYEMQKFGHDEAGQFIHTSGCLDKLVKWIHSNLFLLGGMALGLAIPQLVGIYLSWLLIKQILLKPSGHESESESEANQNLHCHGDNETS
ncbi:hypothetical protein ACEWY4_001812 [Coilia grayii]|uniref:Tetraspanin n=1 Tax=Coilia grayii TaxID=363190 RepID=A0ABD1KTZ9_9TELE